MCKKLIVDPRQRVVDHIEPHRGDPVSMWDYNNTQLLCKSPCHDSHKQTQEKGGVLSGCDEDGMPLDSDHWWK